ncbi:MAG TPA: carboxypeptidase M32 [Solirubrobacteraceae bacterium]|nr:carboxypeptidase M32 [Solirubrobacteraceae bacterium]
MAELRDWLGEISDLRRAAAVLQWDKQTMMPRRGADSRSEQLATLERITHERFISARTGELIEAAEAERGEGPPDSIDARIVSEARRLFDKSRRVPADLAAARTRAAADGYRIWVRARESDDFAAFAPALARNFQLTREYVACFDDQEHPYDVVLDDFAPGMRTAEVTRLLGEMREALVPLIDQLAPRPVDRSPLHGHYGVEDQRRLVARVLHWMGFSDSGWRLDDTVHPFEQSFSVNDIRLTTRYVESYFPTALYAAMHECGHGLYEAGVAPELQRTPLGTIRSSAIHESQSRLWENMVGRSRAFCAALTPLLAEHARGGLDGLAPEALFRAVNTVQPSTIRIEADETTYGLHIVVRFELELALLSGALDVADLPEAWNAKMSQYLGVEVASHDEGVMQDVHWSEALVGYFPAYAIGNLIAGQLWARIRRDIVDLDEQLRRGDLRTLREWLREQVHRHGSRYSDAELLRRVVGEPVQVGPFIAYLRDKLADVYQLELA